MYLNLCCVFGLWICFAFTGYCVLIALLFCCKSYLMLHSQKKIENKYNNYGLQKNTSAFLWLLTQTCFSHSGTSLQTRVPVFIKVRDVNDNAPEFAMYYETFVCENVKAGQVYNQFIIFNHFQISILCPCEVCDLPTMAAYNTGHIMKNLNRKLTMNNNNIAVLYFSSFRP